MKTLITTFRAANAASASTLKNNLLHLKEVSETEQGVVQYEVFQDDTNELIYYVVDSWSSAETLRQHMTQPHVKRFGDLSQTILTEPFNTLIMHAVHRA